MSDKDIELEIQAKGLTAPRITRDDMIANIAHTEIVKHVSVTGQVLRWAIITTKNGFAVTGKPSCAVSSENDNEAIGKQIALTNAENELWPLMGYALKEKLSQQ
ncbi:Gp49 family protein [Escherichia coli]|uniref:Gp49 family protein n=1 Tax=Escherichia coli TaxID=562 RepID=UPI003F57A6D5